LLCVLWGFQAPLERLLGHQELPSAVGWAARQRLGALAADLTDLGVTGTRLPEAAGLPSLASPGAVWGALYVTEGATLGGRVLRRRIEARLGPVPVRFLDGRGDRTQPMWRDLGHLADRYVGDKLDRQLARQTAIQAFAAFSAWASHASLGLTAGEHRADPASGHIHSMPAGRGRLGGPDAMSSSGRG
jgi:heme oxygenase (biliverdin-IX-beta and delta-forming)